MAINKERFDLVLDMITEAGYSLRKALEAQGVNARYFYEFRDSDELYRKQYARAKKISREKKFDEIKDIADNDSDIYYDDAGNKRVDAAAVQKKRLQIDARKWQLAKEEPKKYGDKVDLTSKGGAIQIVIDKKDSELGG